MALLELLQNMEGLPGHLVPLKTIQETHAVEDTGEIVDNPAARLIF